MNKHTKAILGALQAGVDSMEIDGDDLNDRLNSIMGDVDEDKIDQKELRAELVKYLSKKALKTADEMLGMVQQVYNL
jgi:hypothetical protein